MKNASNYDEFEVFDGLQQWDRASVEVVIADSTFQRWVREIPSCGTVNLIGFHFVFLCFIFLWVCFDLNELQVFEFRTLTLFSFNVICGKIIWWCMNYGLNYGSCGALLWEFVVNLVMRLYGDIYYYYYYDSIWFWLCLFVVFVYKPKRSWLWAFVVFCYRLKWSWLLWVISGVFVYELMWFWLCSPSVRKNVIERFWELVCGLGHIHGFKESPTIRYFKYVLPISQF